MKTGTAFYYPELYLRYQYNGAQRTLMGIGFNHVDDNVLLSVYEHGRYFIGNPRALRLNSTEYCRLFRVSLRQSLCNLDYRKTPIHVHVRPNTQRFNQPQERLKARRPSS